MVRRRGLEPLCLAALAPQASASANFATSARGEPIKYSKTEAWKGCSASRSERSSSGLLNLRSGSAGSPSLRFGVVALIFARMRSSASALQYSQSRWIKTELEGMVMLVLGRRGVELLAGWGDLSEEPLGLEGEGTEDTLDVCAVRRGAGRVVARHMGPEHGSGTWAAQRP
jgi:hypothetical protein